MVEIRPPHGTTEQEPTVAATNIDNQRGVAAEERWQVQRALGGQLLEGGLCPLGRIKDLTGERNAKLALDMATLAFGLLVRLHDSSSRPVQWVAQGLRQIADRGNYFVQRLCG